MDVNTKENIKENLESIIEEFNLILANKGLGEYSIQNFKLKNTPHLACTNWKYVCRSNGTCYLKCMD